ncbi:MAG: hypothetical protein FWD18_02545 [Micrococcales bacterium]|nr:hypothetical protein [Micrococcales bacterium]
MGWAIAGTLVAAVLVLVLVGMRSGWAGRARRSEALLPALPQVPDDLGEPLTRPLDAVYVSTVSAGDRLDRVVAHGLGLQASATVRVFTTGVLVDRAGVRLFLDPEHLRSVATSAGQAGKMLRDPDALVVLEWAPSAPDDGTGETRGPLASALRMRRSADQEALIAAVDTLLRDSDLDDDRARENDRTPENNRTFENKESR